MFESILLAYDGSVGAARALEKAVPLAKLTDARLVILTVYRHHSMLEASLSMVRPEPVTTPGEALKAAAREAADYAKSRAVAAGLERVSAFIRPGHTARTIVRVAEEKDCDLIVVGARGLGSAESYLLGSVSHKVTGISNCPVLVV